MQNPVVGTGQFIEQNVMNSISQFVTGNFQTIGTAGLHAGLIHPEAVTVTANGGTGIVTLNPPFAVLFSNGTLVEAETQQVFTFDLSKTVPASGSVKVYFSISLSTPIQTNPVQVVGPQVGHPAFNPNFSPYTLYTLNVDTITIACTPQAPNNLGNFAFGYIIQSSIDNVSATSYAVFRYELVPGTVSQGQGSVPNPAGQRASSLTTKGVVTSSGTFTLGSTHAQHHQMINGTSTLTLPPATLYNGVEFSITSATTGSVVINSQGGNQIYGTKGTFQGGVTTFGVSAGVTFNIVGIQGDWYTTSISSNFIHTGNKFSFDVAAPPGVPITLVPGDILVVTWENVTFVPLHVVSTPGIYRCHVMTYSNTGVENQNIHWRPNDQQYPPVDQNVGPFRAWYMQNQDQNGDGSGAAPPWYLGDTSYADYQTWGDYPIALFRGPEIGGTPNDFGQSMIEVLINTYTPSKSIMGLGGITGGPGIFYTWWTDTTTPWTSLGTLDLSHDDNPYFTWSGAATIEKLV